MNHLNIPVTADFDDRKQLGMARLSLDDDQLELLIAGRLSFSIEYITEIEDIEKKNSITIYKKAQLVGISLIPTQNYINYLKRQGVYNDNNDSPNSIKE